MLSYISAANIITVYVDPIMYGTRPAPHSGTQHIIQVGDTGGALTSALSFVVAL